MSTDEEFDLATAVIGGVKELFALYESAKSGKVSASDAITAAKLFADRIAANRVAAQTALDAKFKTP